MALMHDFKSQFIGGFKETFIPKKKVTVEMIHNEFNSAGEKILAKAKNILATISKGKGERLKKLGFLQAKDTDSIQVVDDAELLKTRILDYSVRYPMYRFITEESIANICKKYNLVYGPIQRFRGFVPLEKLQAIENFKKTCKVPRMARFSPYDSGKTTTISMEGTEEKKDDEYTVLYYKGKHAFQQRASAYDGINFYGSDPDLTGGRGGRIEILDLQICAPRKDMDTTGMKLDGHIMKLIPKDPVVIQPIEGGGLIIAAWGDEASDPLVVNEKLN